MAGYAGFVNKGTTNRLAVAATSIILVVPANIVSGRLLIACLFSPSGIDWASPPAGWTSVNAYSTGTGVSFLHFYSRVATGTESADYTWSGASSRKHEGVILQYNTNNAAETLDDVDIGTDSASSTSPIVVTTTTDVNNGDTGEQLLFYGVITKLAGGGVGASGWTLVEGADVAEREVFGQDNGLAVAGVYDEEWNDAVTAYPAGRTWTADWVGADATVGEVSVRRYWDTVQILASAELPALRLLKIQAGELPHQLHTRML